MTTTRSKRRTGIVKYLGNVLDETKDLVDDMLDRARDVEHDMRDTVRRAVETDDEDAETRDDELAELRRTVLLLTQKVEELSALQRAEREPKDSENQRKEAKP